jgi:hypothetical protein
MKMPTSKEQPISRATRTTAQELERQRRDAERDLAARKNPKPLTTTHEEGGSFSVLNPPPAKRGIAVSVAAGAAAAAVPDTRTPVQTYLDEIAPASIIGRMVKFDSKGGRFFTADDDEEISADDDFVVLADQTLIGRVKFHGKGEPPDRRMGLLYDGFVMPDRKDLGDTDQAKWEIGLDGKPADPWQHHIYLVLQNVATGELFTFATSNDTGRRAAGNLLRHYDRLTKTHPDMYPVVRLKVGGFNHRDERVGWINTPMFAVVGRMPKDSAAKPDTSLAAQMDDELPY